jgi:hypothetical protein
MNPSATTRSRARERGGITWVTVVLLASLLTAGYLAVAWGPVYIVNYEVRVVTGEFANRAVNDRDDARLVAQLCEKLGSLGRVKTPEPDGSISEVRAVDLRPEDVTWERHADSMPRTLRIAFEYTTSVHYPVFDHFSEKTFAVELEQDISPVKW